MLKRVCVRYKPCCHRHHRGLVVVVVAKLGCVYTRSMLLIKIYTNQPTIIIQVEGRQAGRKTNSQLSPFIFHCLPFLPSFSAILLSNSSTNPFYLRWLCCDLRFILSIRVYVTLICCVRGLMLYFYTNVMSFIRSYGLSVVRCIDIFLLRCHPVASPSLPL